MTTTPEDDEEVISAVLTRKHVTTMCAILVAAWLPVLLFGQDVVQSAAALYGLASSQHPYWQPSHGFLLYAAVPLVTLSGIAFVLTSGLLTSLIVARPGTLGEWLLQGFASSVVILAVLNSVLYAMSDGFVTHAMFVWGVVIVSAAAGTLLYIRAERAARALPLQQPVDSRALLVSALAVIVVLSALAPKFLWENFNGDGVHAFEASRLLLTQPVPFWDKAAGAISYWPGTTSMLFTYPTSWFIQLFGPLEFSARIAVVLYVVLLFGGVSAFAQFFRKRPLDVTEQVLLWLALFVYVVTVGFSGTYNPYAADLALPGTQDTLVVVCFVGFLLATLRRSMAWLAVWGLFTYLTLPNGLLLMGLWWLAIAMLFKPLPVRLLVSIALIAIGCVVFGAVLPAITTAAGFPAPGTELGSGALLTRFQFLQLTDVRRILFLVIPCGILPALSLGAWRRQNAFLRALTVTTLAYFFITYIQAYASLHYYIPAMLLPLVVFWSVDWGAAKRGWKLASTGVAAVLALWLSWPDSAQPDVSARTVGSMIEDRVSGYTTSRAEQFRATALLENLFPFDWDPHVPNDGYGGSPIVWNYYAHTPKTGVANYVLQRVNEPPPALASLVKQNAEFALFVRDSAVWQAHMQLRPHTPAGARIYQIPRELLFRSGSAGIHIVNMKALMRKLKRKLP